MTVRAYPVYRESGSSWFDRLPSEWKCLPFKAVVSRLESGTSVNSDDRPVEGEELGVLKTSCVYTGAFDARENKAIMPAEYSRASCPIRVNHLIVSRMNTPDLIGAAGLVTQPADNLYLPDRLWQIGLQGAVPKFTHYWTRSAAYKSQVQAACSGTSSSMQNLSQPQLLSFHFPCPSVIEQAAIAAFLDRETGKIDALVAEQERLIALLKEKRQAVISHVVTKGLNPNAPMKNSGVPWLGEVPEHWEMKRLKHVADGITVGVVVMPSQYYTESGVPALRSQNVREMLVNFEGLVYFSEESNEILRKSKLRAGDLVAVRTGQPGVTAVVPAELDEANCIDLIIIRKSGAINSQFISYIMNSGVCKIQYDQGSGGAIQQHFNIETAGNLTFALPSLDMQAEIVSYLDVVTEKLDDLRLQAARAITLLRERRAALISAAIIGKIDVRDTVPAAQHAA